MPLSPGTRLGPYEITAPLGVGGMGEVYRAIDTNLKRQVAIKVLPASVTSDTERVARFQREAEVLAALNHPNIAHIHGLEKSDGTVALVMELVEGPTLADHIAKGAIPIDDALPIAKQIAEALEAAHEQGIIHRDLKPANIKVRPDGTAKILDFGLAKAFEPTTGPSANMSMSPTITSPAMTQAGIILGTAAYMSPEQAVGKPVDKRADLWSFGVVLLEMLTGRQVFHGETVSHVLASVLKDSPDLTALPATTPTSIRRLLRRCLEKDRRRRLDSAADARLEIDEALAGTPDVMPTSAVVASGRLPLWQRIAVAAVALATAAVIGAAAASWMSHSTAPVIRTTIGTSASTGLFLGLSGRHIAITPDGSRIVYRGTAAQQLLVRPLNQLAPLSINGLGAPQNLFVSPDGQWIGFFDTGRVLKKVLVTGGLPFTISGAIDGAGPRGATWGPDGTIIFATNSVATGLLRVPAAGGDPVVLTRPDREKGERDHQWPEFLPGGGAVLFTILPVGGGTENAQIALLDLKTGTYKVILRGATHAQYVQTGHLVYGVGGALRAVGFDLKRLEVVGTPVPVIEGVVTTPQGSVEAVVADNGSLLYVSGPAGSRGGQTVVSVDRQGHVSPLPGLPLDSYRDVRVSPDGTRLALATADDVWIYDLSRATLTRLTTDPAEDTRPLWTPDGTRIVFSSDRSGYPELYWRPADGTGSDELLVTRAKDLIDLRADGWSADGKQLLFTELASTASCVISQIPIERPSDVKVLLKNAFCNDYPAVSPDGRWMAYHSTPSGRQDVFVERYPDLGDRLQISTGGGMRPVWSPDGRELFFATPDNQRMLSVRVEAGKTLVAGRQEALFELASLASGGGARPYDLARDGRFYVIRSAKPDGDSGTSSNLILVQNWFEELKRLVPAK